MIQQLKIIREQIKRGNDLKEREIYYEKRMIRLANEIEPLDHKIALVIDHLLKL